MNIPSLIITGKRRRIPLRHRKIIIGRSPNVTIPLEKDPKVSWKHTEILRKSDGYVVRDLKSTNGTLLNGRRVTEPHLLRHNDRLQIGKTGFSFDLGDFDFDEQFSSMSPSEPDGAEWLIPSGQTTHRLAPLKMKVPDPIDKPAEPYHFDPTEPLSLRLGRVFAGRNSYKSKAQAQDALRAAKRVLIQVESAYKPTKVNLSNSIFKAALSKLDFSKITLSKVVEWLQGSLSLRGISQKRCDETGLSLNVMASPIYTFDAAEDILQLIRARNTDLLEYVPMAGANEQTQQHYTQLALWWHKQAETAYLEQTVYFGAHILGKQDKAKKSVSAHWLVASVQLDRMMAQRYLKDL
ncbi:MAG: FHA domain-containing protein [Chloroflexota bacterium]